MYFYNANLMTEYGRARFGYDMIPLSVLILYRVSVVQTGFVKAIRLFTFHLVPLPSVIVTLPFDPAVLAFGYLLKKCFVFAPPPLPARHLSRPIFYLI